MVNCANCGKSCNDNYFSNKYTVSCPDCFKNKELYAFKKLGIKSIAEMTYKQAKNYRILPIFVKEISAMLKYE